MDRWEVYAKECSEARAKMDKVNASGISQNSDAWQRACGEYHNALDGAMARRVRAS